MRVSDLLNRLIRLPVSDEDGAAAVLRCTKAYHDAPHWIEVYETVGDHLPPVTVCSWNSKGGDRCFISAHGRGWTAMFSYPSRPMSVDWHDECDVLRLYGEDALLRDVVMLKLGV